MLNPQPGGPGFDFGLCSHTEVGKRLRRPPCPLVAGHSLSDPSADNWRPWETLPVATLRPA
jgi:hypothetical protein